MLDKNLNLWDNKICYERYRKKKRIKKRMGIDSPSWSPRLGIIQTRNLERPKASPYLANGWYGGKRRTSQKVERTPRTKSWNKRLTFYQNCDTIKSVMRKTTKNIKWLISDLGLNELDAWLWMIGGAALTAAVLVLLTGEGPEVYRYWRVFFLNL